MKVIQIFPGIFSTLTCFGCNNRVKFWSGHIHNNENYNRLAQAGWCSPEHFRSFQYKKCSLKMPKCCGKHRLRGFSK